MANDGPLKLMYLNPVGTPVKRQYEGRVWRGVLAAVVTTCTVASIY